VIGADNSAGGSARCRNPATAAEAKSPAILPDYVARVLDEFTNVELNAADHVGAHCPIVSRRS